MDILDGYYIKKILSALFKNHPNCLFVFFAFGIVIVFVLIIVEAQNPNDLVLPILLFAFVLVVVVGQIVGVIRKKSVQESKVIEEKPPDQEKPHSQETPILHSEEMLHKAPPLIRQTVQYPGLKGKEFLQGMMICVVFFAFGFLLVPFVVINILSAQVNQQIIDFLNPEQYEFFFNDIGNQFTCILPCALSMVMPILAILTLSLSLITKSNQKKLRIICAILSFSFGVLVYVPIKTFIGFAMAF